jgi:tRNA pseudouridine38-40 synthase
MILSYDGSRYFGWEHQPNTEMTIQGKLELVLSRILYGEDYRPKDFASCPVTVIGAGRTDAGVHARAMTANVILDTDLTEDALRNMMNRYLPEDISINELKICSDRFHSRFNASGKTYRYTCD